MSGVAHVTVDVGEGDQRLDRWFRRRFPHVTQGAIEKMLRKGEIRLDGARARASVRVAEGQVVRVPPLPDPENGQAKSAGGIGKRDHELAERLRRRVIYEDDDLLVLDKPPGLAVQGGSGQTQHLDGLLPLLAGRGEVPRLVHRLDRDTSGLLVLARSREVAARLTAAFRGRAVSKTYFAAVAGRPAPPDGTIAFPLVKTRDGQGKERVRCAESSTESERSAAQAARTEYRTISSAGGRASWLALRPVTGRTHQLRVHLAAIGCPIFGDGKYGGRGRTNEGSGWGAGAGPAISRLLHLHSAELEFDHPRSAQRLRFVAALPPHMAETWKFFGWDPADFLADPFSPS